MSLEIIKKLRDETGAGIGDIKKALDEAGGDETGAVEILRKSGQKIAAKKAERSTNEGLVAMHQEGNKIAVVALACETDFVARNENFISAVDIFSKKLLEVGKDEFAKWAEAEIQNNLIVKIGENIKLGGFDIIESSSAGEIIGSYLHANNKIASVVVLTGGDEEKAKDVAMHVAAMNPTYLKPEDVPADVLEKEKEIYREQLKKEDKPEEMLEKILEGKVQKFYAEVCLIKQQYIKDDKLTIEKYLGEAKVERFIRISL